MATQPLEKLSKKQLLLLERYLIHYDGARAAREAGYSTYSAARIAHRIVNDSLFQEELKRREASILAELKENQMRTARELSYIAHVNLADCFDENGVPIPIQDLPPEISAAIGECWGDVIYSEDGTRAEIKLRYKMNDKLGALDKLAKMQKLIGADMQLTLPEHGAIYLPVEKPEGAPVDPSIQESQRDKGESAK